MERIGWIGLGLMGSRMLPHLIEAGHPVSIFARSDDAAAPFVARGATRADDPAALAAECDVVITIVAMPSDVEDVYLSERGLLAGVRSGGVLIDMTTSSPALARRIAEAGLERSSHVLDAPVSGGPTGAEAGSLSIMLGGDAETAERFRPILGILGDTIVNHGGPGAGQSAKIANQIVVGGSMLALAEAFVSAQAAGLDSERVLETLGAGIAGSGLMKFMWPRFASGDMEPGFRVEHLIKDLGLALDAAHDSGTALPGTALVKEVYHQVLASGFAGKGSQSIVTAVDRKPGGPQLA
jgi:3-hydroxyisobutyrate dehydrogenase